MNTANWPGGIDRSAPNWTGRTPRTSYSGGNWAPDSHRIPRRAWIGAALVTALLFIIVPVVGAIAGF